MNRGLGEAGDTVQVVGTHPAHRIASLPILVVVLFLFTRNPNPESITDPSIWNGIQNRLREIVIMYLKKTHGSFKVLKAQAQALPFCHWHSVYVAQTRWVCVVKVYSTP